MEFNSGFKGLSQTDTFLLDPQAVTRTKKENTHSRIGLRSENFTNMSLYKITFLIIKKRTRMNCLNICF